MTENKGKEIVSKLVPLSKVKKVKDIPQLTHALFPGTHCPLMGAAMAVGGIKGSMLVVVGTDECTYYTKSMTIHSENFGGLNGRCVSVVLNDHDVTFGSTEKMHEAFKEIMEGYHPECVFLVTTCVIEIIGDDYDAIAEELSKEYHIPVAAVHTEHFKCEDHFPGLERTLTACAELMTPQEKDGSVNVLGQRMGDFSTTELAALLRAAGQKIGVQLPSGCTVDEVRRAAAAKVNIVVHDIALPLAQEMEAKFGIPYVYFNRFADPEKIYANYQSLFKYLELPMPAEVEEDYAKCKALIAEKQAKLEGITYIYGNTPYDCFEINNFMTNLGMLPQVIQTNRLPEHDQENIQGILSKADPLLCKSANIAPLQYVYDEVHPHLYLGHEFGARLRKKGIAVVHSDMALNMLGFETTIYLLGQIEKAIDECFTYRKELGL